MDLLQIIPEKCSDIRTCVNSCPVRAIKHEGGRETLKINQERCISCANCLLQCSDGAVKVYDSIGETLQLIKSGDLVAAIVDPSISAEFPDVKDYRKFVEMIRAIGFSHVIESSFGVDLLAIKYKALFDNFKGKYYISANCPVIVSYVLKYHPELTDNLVPLVPPSVVTSLVSRKLYGSNLKIVYITPCIAAKAEALEFNGDSKIDSVLTFGELRAIFEQKEILESTFEYSDFDPPFGLHGTLFPIANGFLQSAGISEDLLQGNVLTVTGQKQMISAIREFETNIESIKKHLNIYYDNGCMMGPGMTRKENCIKRHADVVRYSNKRVASIDFGIWEQNIERFSKLDLSRKFEKNDQRPAEPSEENIAGILEKIRKINSVDSRNCAKCGFESCRDFAKAVFVGDARLEHCYDYAFNSQLEYLKTLSNTNEKLARINETFRDNEKQLKTDNELTSEKMEIFLGAIKKVPTGIVIADDSLKIIYSNEKFIEMLGEDALMIADVIPGLIGADLKTLLPPLFYRLFSSVMSSDEDSISRDLPFEDKLFNINVFKFEKKSIVGGIIKDMSAPEVQAEQVTERLTEVIDQNLNMVQQIGFLLGEGASKTEAMLNSIIKSYHSRKTK